MKIGIISINAHTKVLNFASPLHTYAFQSFLDENGIESTIIDYKPVYYGNFDVRHPLFYYVDHPDSNEKKQKRLLRKWKNLFYEREKRFDRFQEFIDTYYKKTDKCYSAAILEEEDANFDCYICVTDVIWKYSPNTGFDKGYFLASKTMEGKKKIAYSPSRGAKGYTAEQEDLFLDYIMDFDYLSAREESLKNYIEELTGLNVPQVIDPVFLRNRDFYHNLAIHPKRKKGFVLIYVVMQDATETVKEAVEFAERHNLDVIELSEELKNAHIPEGTYHDVIYDIGVEEWLGYMEEAEYIFTNSFHACCFSMIFDKQFFAGGRAGDKIDSMLAAVNLTSRRIGEKAGRSSLDIQNDINFAPVHKILDEWIEKSKKYILEAIQDVENRDHIPVLKTKPIIVREPEVVPNEPKNKQPKKKKPFFKRVIRKIKKIIKSI